MRSNDGMDDGGRHQPPSPTSASNPAFGMTYNTATSSSRWAATAGSAPASASRRSWLVNAAVAGGTGGPECETHSLGDGRTAVSMGTAVTSVTHRGKPRRPRGRAFHLWPVTWWAVFSALALTAAVAPWAALNKGAGRMEAATAAGPGGAAGACAPSAFDALRWRGANAVAALAAAGANATSPLYSEIVATDGPVALAAARAALAAPLAAAVARAVRPLAAGGETFGAALAAAAVVVPWPAAAAASGRALRIGETAVRAALVGGNGGAATAAEALAAAAAALPATATLVYRAAVPLPASSLGAPGTRPTAVAFALGVASSALEEGTATATTTATTTTTAAAGDTALAAVLASAGRFRSVVAVFGFGALAAATAAGPTAALPAEALRRQRWAGALVEPARVEAWVRAAAPRVACHVTAPCPLTGGVQPNISGVVLEVEASRSASASSSDGSFAVATYDATLDALVVVVSAGTGAARLAETPAGEGLVASAAWARAVAASPSAVLSGTGVGGGSGAAAHPAQMAVLLIVAVAASAALAVAVLRLAHVHRHWLKVLRSGVHYLSVGAVLPLSDTLVEALVEDEETPGCYAPSEYRWLLMQLAVTQGEVQTFRSYWKVRAPHRLLARATQAAHDLLSSFGGSADGSVEGVDRRSGAGGRSTGASGALSPTSAGLGSGAFVTSTAGGSGSGVPETMGLGGSFANRNMIYAMPGTPPVSPKGTMGRRPLDGMGSDEGATGLGGLIELVGEDVAVTSDSSSPHGPGLVPGDGSNGHIQLPPKRNNAGTAEGAFAEFVAFGKTPRGAWLPQDPISAMMASPVDMARWGGAPRPPGGGGGGAGGGGTGRSGNLPTGIGGLAGFGASVTSAAGIGAGMGHAGASLQPHDAAQLLQFAEAEARDSSGRELRRRKATICTIVVRSLDGDFFAGSAPSAIESLVEQSQQMLTQVLGCIDDFNGAVQSFSVGRVVATWNAKSPFPFHELRGAMCAAHLASILDDIMQPHSRWSIAVTSGSVVSGESGTDRHETQVAAGEAVVLGPLLCDLGMVLRCNIVVTEAVYVMVRTQVSCLPVDVVTIGGTASTLYELRANEHPVSGGDVPYMAAFWALCSQQYDKAQQLFSDLEVQRPNDRQVSRLGLLSAELKERREEAQRNGDDVAPYARGAPAWVLHEAAAEAVPLPDDITFLLGMLDDTQSAIGAGGRAASLSVFASRASFGLGHNGLPAGATTPARAAAAFGIPYVPLPGSLEMSPSSTSTTGGGGAGAGGAAGGLLGHQGPGSDGALGHHSHSGTHSGASGVSHTSSSANLAAIPTSPASPPAPFMLPRTPQSRGSGSHAIDLSMFSAAAATTPLPPSPARWGPGLASLALVPEQGPGDASPSPLVPSESLDADAPTPAAATAMRAMEMSQRGSPKRRTPPQIPGSTGDSDTFGDMENAAFGCDSSAAPPLPRLLTGLPTKHQSSLRARVVAPSNLTTVAETDDDGVEGASTVLSTNNSGHFDRIPLSASPTGGHRSYRRGPAGSPSRMRRSGSVAHDIALRQQLEEEVASRIKEVEALERTLRAEASSFSAGTGTTGDEAGDFEYARASTRLTVGEGDDNGGNSGGSTSRTPRTPRSPRGPPSPQSVTNAGLAGTIGGSSAPLLGGMMSTPGNHSDLAPGGASASLVGGLGGSSVGDDNDKGGVGTTQNRSPNNSSMGTSATGRALWARAGTAALRSLGSSVTGGAASASKAGASIVGSPAPATPVADENDIADRKGTVWRRSGKVLGKGTFGEVFVGLGSTGALCAIKTMTLPDLSDDNLRSTILTANAAGASLSNSFAFTSPSSAPGPMLGGTTANNTLNTTFNNNNNHTNSNSSNNSNTNSIAAPSIKLLESASGGGGSSHTVGSAFRLSKEVEDFLSEVALLSTLRHDHIVQYLSSTIIRGKPVATANPGGGPPVITMTPPQLAIMMEYMSGGSLTKILQHFGRIPLAAARRFTRDILLGLAFLHSRGIIHRDISPNNVLLNIDGMCKLSDFGCASSLGKLNGMVAGTPAFMAPEACRGEPQTASDVWSLGIMLFMMLTGALPYRREDTVPVADFLDRLGARGAEVRGLPPLVPDIHLHDATAAALPAEAAPFVLACLAGNPKERSTAQELLTHPFVLS